MDPEIMRIMSPTTRSTVTQNEGPTYPDPGTVWVHYRGGRYVLSRVVNQLYAAASPKRAQQFPVMAVYYLEGSKEQDTLWFARPLGEFLENFKPAP